MNANLRKAVLHALNKCGTYTLLESDLHDACSLLERPRPLLNELQHELAIMEREGLVVGGRNPVKEIRWKLTADGAAAATELGY